MYVDCGNTIMTSFTHKGSRIRDIAVINPKHLSWFVKDFQEDTKEKLAARRLLCGYEQIEKKIQLAPDNVAECAKFGGDCAITTEYYAARNQPDFGKWSDDAKIGKIGEWVARQALTELFEAVTDPDTRIYEHGDKTWASDLIDLATGLRFAIKTQRVESVEDYKFPMSWVFEKKDPVVIGEKVMNIKCVFVMIDLRRNYGYVAAICNVSSLHEARDGRKNLFKPPVKVELKSKTTIHHSDLKKYNLLCEL